MYIKPVLKLNNPALLAGSKVQDRHAISSLGLHITALDDISLATVRKRKLMLLVRASVHNKHPLVAVLLPRENLRGRVQQVNTTDIVVGDVELRVAAVERKLAAELGNGDVALAGGEGDLVVGVLEGVESGVPDDEELGAVAVEGGDGEVRVSGVASVNVGAVLVLGGEVRRGCLDEVGFKLGFAVFLTVDEALFADDGRVVVASVAAGVAEVAPCQV